MSSERSRRSNRGNNLYKLINEERELLNQDSGVNRNNADEDEIMDLVFQEREDDADMEIDENSNNSDDDAFSASDSSSEEESDSESDGESKTDRSNMKKRMARRNKHIPVLIKRNNNKSTAVKRKRQDSDMFNSADFLDTETRRLSSRTSTKSNRMKTYENLKNEEINRKKRNLGKPEKVVEVLLTQEQRLANAAETEKLNIESLQRFREIEIFEKRLIEEQHKKYKVKFKDQEKVLRYSSDIVFVSPNDYEELKKQELEDETRLMSKSLKKKFLEQKSQEFEKIKEGLPYLETFDVKLEGDEVTKEPVFQGPDNKVKRNLFTLYNFNSYEKPSSKDLKTTYNFNIVPKDQEKMERLIHLEYKKSNELESESKQTGSFIFSKQEIQRTMNNFRKFGEYGNFSKVIYTNENEDTETGQQIQLRYLLEPSLFYKNVADTNTTNIKKNCYIKYNEKVKYIDPKLNISYSDLDVFKRLTNLVNHDQSIKWMSLTEESGTYVGTDTVPAKGVPEGF